MASITLNPVANHPEDPSPHLGDAITFTHNEEAKYRHDVYIEVKATQNGVATYQEISPANDPLVLGGGGGGIGTWFGDGGSADCIASLFVFEQGNKPREILATTSFISGDRR